MSKLRTNQTFTAGDTVTATKLNDLIAQGGAYDITREDMDANSRLVTVSESQPVDQAEGELRYTATEKRLLVNVGDSNEVGVDGEMILSYAANGNGDAVQGNVVVIDTSAGSTCTHTTTAANELVAGVIMNPTTVTDGLDARVARTGLRTVNMAAAAGWQTGWWLYTSTEPGKATASANMSPGAFGIVVQSGSGTGGSVLALIKEAPAAAVPTGSLIIWDQSTSCPPGFSIATEWHTYSPKFVDGSSTLDYSNAGVTSTITPIPGNVHPSGDDIYQSDEFTGLIPSTGVIGTGYEFDTDSASQQQSAGLNITGGQAGDGWDGGDQGNHRHALNGVNNVPKSRFAMLCRKD